jgi:DNA-binding IclR family transcriptional regulator
MPTETILRLLENGKWHYLKDLEKETHLASGKVETVTKFLATYNFVKLDEAEQKVRIDPPTNRFLKKIRQLENEENH